MKTTTKHKVMALVVFFGASFVLHMLWENLHYPLYTCFMCVGHFFFCSLLVVARGDLVLMAIVYLSVAVVHRDFWWILYKKNYKHPGTWIVPVSIGILLAVVIELWAVYLVERWAYQATMPIIPILEVGLTPILQMIVIPILVIWISKKIIARR